MEYDWSGLIISCYGSGDEAAKVSAPLLCGKTIKSIRQSEYSFTLLFDDGSEIEFQGNSYEGPLSVTYTDA